MRPATSPWYWGEDELPVVPRRLGSEPLGGGGPVALGLVTGVGRADRLDEEHVTLLGRDGAVLQPARDDEHLPGADVHVVSALQPDREPASQDDEDFVGVVVLMPDEFTQ